MKKLLGYPKIELIQSLLRVFCYSTENIAYAYKILQYACGEITALGHILYTQLNHFL